MGQSINGLTNLYSESQKDRRNLRTKIDREHAEKTLKWKWLGIFQKQTNKQKEQEQK